MKEHLSKFRLVLRITGTLLGLGILIYQIVTSLRNFDWTKLTASVLYYALIALVINILAIILQMAAWKLIMGGTGHNISLMAIFSGFSLSFVSRYIPGTIWGYLARGEWLKREHEVPYSMTNIGSLIEIAGFLITNAFVVLQGYLLAGNIGFSIIIFIAMLFGGWAILNLLFLWKPTRRIFHLDIHRVDRFPFSRWFCIYILYILMWGCFGLSLMTFANGIGWQIGFSNFVHLSSIYSLAWFIGFIIVFIPSGIGLREFSLTVLLMSQYGLAQSTFSFIAIGFRVLILLAELFWIIFGIATKGVSSTTRKPLVQ